ncbi:TATA-binding protein-associated factor 172 [Chionoecetes opilio]|uniref:TATA-binding protein-associated factor 172 n=1 Tax=Chionoecetes opilio TaxID=41210 RepID=A0A8J4Y0N9_CHIOP|nr:TATA-binding protein-associated factor 172 [Chionoecetes opilio]
MRSPPVHLPSVTYLRLDGSVPAGSRHSLVQRFNSDPSIDLLLLTTQVGGLGLNLTGADTVIFVEHDWNPMRDLQAMDRAHRIGQKRVVNVYRLVTRGTLEEKIMGLQKFKLMTANTVISQENSSMMSMGTSQLFDLFTLDSGKAGVGCGIGAEDPTSITTTSHTLGLAAGGGGGAKAVLDSLPDLWDEAQYENEYDLDTFMTALRKSAPRVCGSHEPCVWVRGLCVALMNPVCGSMNPVCGLGCVALMNPVCGLGGCVWGGSHEPRWCGSHEPCVWVRGLCVALMNPVCGLGGCVWLS